MNHTIREIKTTPFFIIRRLSDKVEFISFNNVFDMESTIEDICVSRGEEGKLSGIIYESMSYDERKLTMGSEVSP